MKPRAGLTFVELLIAATIFAILAMGLSAHLRAGIDVWRRTSSSMESTQRRRVLTERLRLELANAVLISVDHMHEPSALAAPVFGERTLAFVTALPVTGGTERRLRFVRYEQQGDRVVRRECAFQEAVAGPCGQDETLVEQSDALVLRYASRDPKDPSSLVWNSAWDPKHLPALVDVRLAVEAQPEPARWVRIPQGTWQSGP